MGIQHNLIVFDYNNTETFIKVEKINEIINSNIVIDESIEKENLNDFFDDNYDKTKENEIKCIKFNSNFEKEEIENNNNLFEFINIIIADYLRYPNYTHFFKITFSFNDFIDLEVFIKSDFFFHSIQQIVFIFRNDFSFRKIRVYFK